MPVHEPPVALEANFPYVTESESTAWRDVLALELGSMDGGYGWSFPKSDHFNVGCGGWKNVGGKLRDHLASLRHHYGLDANAMVNLRGHHLPTRTEGTLITAGRVVLVGDAAGLVDPMSGEGIYAAFVSGRLAATAIRRFLDNKDPDLYPYEAAVERELMGEIRAAGMLRDATTSRRACWWALQRSEARRAMCQLITGEDRRLLKQLGPLSAVRSGSRGGRPENRQLNAEPDPQPAHDVTFALSVRRRRGLIIHETNAATRRSFRPDGKCSVLGHRPLAGLVVAQDGADSPRPVSRRRHRSSSSTSKVAPCRWRTLPAV